MIWCIALVFIIIYNYSIIFGMETSIIVYQWYGICQCYFRSKNNFYSSFYSVHDEINLVFVQFLCRASVVLWLTISPPR